ncbi:MAG TPA: hypothetical protein VNR87_10170 [Flavisolibacter sp.]|nr:hypothetical protein [Flavisolibacter sp.]
MAQDRKNSGLRDDEHTEDNSSPMPEANKDQFESDTQKIVRRHLENKDDVITEDDIRNVRIGMTPEFDEATESRFEDENARQEAEEKYLGPEEDRQEETTEEDRITPWDTVEND